MVTKEKSDVDTKEDKGRRIVTALANMDIGESVSPTNFFSNIQIHPDTGRWLLDVANSLKGIGYKTVGDKTGKIRAIIRTDEELNVRSEIREIKKELIDIKGMLDQLNSGLKKHGMSTQKIKT